MNKRHYWIQVILIVSTAMPVQANVQTVAAQTLSYLRQGFKLYVSNPIMWGYHKALTPSTLTAAIIAGAGAVYLANYYLYGEREKGENETDGQQGITNFCILATIAGTGAAAGSGISTLTHHSANKGALFGALTALGVLLIAESGRSLYKKHALSITSLIRETTTPIEQVRVGDLCDIFVLFGIGSLTGMGSTWLLNESPNFGRSAVAGLIGGAIGKAVFDSKWAKSVRAYSKDR